MNGWSCGGMFFSVRAGEVWNLVPPTIKSARTANAFKTSYAKHRLGMI
jgi:hypothetical protein